MSHDQDASPSLRLFLALWPEASTRQQLQTWQAAQTWPFTTRPTRPEDLHLTLHFLGQVPEGRSPALWQALSSHGYHVLRHIH